MESEVNVKQGKNLVCKHRNEISREIQGRLKAKVNIYSGRKKWKYFFLYNKMLNVHYHVKRQKRYERKLKREDITKWQKQQGGKNKKCRKKLRRKLLKGSTRKLV